MQVNQSIFRGYDIRGLVGTDLSSGIYEHIGKAHGTYLKNKGINKAIVGYDCRATSPEYSEAFIKGLTWTGLDVVNIGLTMIGNFYWAQYYLNIKGGAFITASHNPAEYNGMKLASDFSETLVSEGIQELKELVLNENYSQGEKEGIVTKQDINEVYFKDILSRFSNLKPMKVLIDSSNATAGAIVPNALRQAGFEVVEKNCNIDPAFPLGTPDPTESAVAKRISNEVIESGADIGFTYDADGDRIGIIDEKGGIIWNDIFVAFMAADVLTYHPGSVITFNTLCSKLVEETIIKNGGKPNMVRTGHSFVKKYNKEVGGAFAGELSGHFFFSADFYNHDDGFYSTVRLLDYLGRTGQKLSQAVATLPQYISSPEIKIGCADDKKVALMVKVSEILKKDYPQAEIIDDERRAGDGVRLNLIDGMFVVRYSQNGPYLTIKFEANTNQKYQELKVYIKTLLHSFSEVDWNYGVNVESLE
jgi:phosphomannomutase / phosphoglucomutase